MSTKGFNIGERPRITADTEKHKKQGNCLVFRH